MTKKKEKKPIRLGVVRLGWQYVVNLDDDAMIERASAALLEDIRSSIINSPRELDDEIVAVPSPEAKESEINDWLQDCRAGVGPATHGGLQRSSDPGNRLDSASLGVSRMGPHYRPRPRWVADRYVSGTVQADSRDRHSQRFSGEIMYSKTKCLVCGNALSTADYEDGEPRICGKCWKCPVCGVKASTAQGSDGVVLDDDDTVICRPCDMAWSFKKFENALVKKANLVACPTCKGKGTVAGKKG